LSIGGVLTVGDRSLGLGEVGFLDLDLGDGLLLIPSSMRGFFSRIREKIVPISVIFFLDAGPRLWG
jgi:hypothetical protein